MSLYEYYIRNNLEIPKPSGRYGIRIRNPPDRRGKLPKDEWDYLKFDPDLQSPWDRIEGVSLEESRRRNLKELERLRRAAELAKEKRLLAKQDKKESCGQAPDILALMQAAWDAVNSPDPR